jgi:hypothetical protein
MTLFPNQLFEPRHQRAQTIFLVARRLDVLNSFPEVRNYANHSGRDYTFRVSEILRRMAIFFYEMGILSLQFAMTWSVDLTSSGTRVLPSGFAGEQHLPRGKGARTCLAEHIFSLAPGPDMESSRWSGDVS